MEMDFSWQVLVVLTAHEGFVKRVDTHHAHLHLALNLSLLAQ